MGFDVALGITRLLPCFPKKWQGHTMWNAPPENADPSWPFGLGISPTSIAGPGQCIKPQSHQFLEIPQSHHHCQSLFAWTNSSSLMAKKDKSSTFLVLIIPCHPRSNHVVIAKSPGLYRCLRPGISGHGGLRAEGRGCTGDVGAVCICVYR